MIMEKQKLRIFYLILAVVAILSLFKIVTAPVALVAGIIVAFFIGNPNMSHSHKLSKEILQWSIVGMGFGINLKHAAEAGAEGLLVTAISIGLTLTIGYFIGRKLNIDKNTTILITSGTAICGGSAIAAVAPVIDAKENETSVSLATIFLLNAIALLIFPSIGRFLSMSGTQFGFWSAIAIHDTSSVVGAASAFGKETLELATTIKLERSLWIVPVSLIFSYLVGGGKKGAKVPLFIILFVVAMAIGTYLPIPESVLSFVSEVARRTLNIALFLIGTGLSLKALKNVGARPIIFGVVLWIIVGTVSAYAISIFI